MDKGPGVKVACLLPRGTVASKQPIPSNLNGLAYSIANMKYVDKGEGMIYEWVLTI